jgi:hypothetical protein
VHAQFITGQLPVEQFGVSVFLFVLAIAGLFAIFLLLLTPYRESVQAPRRLHWAFDVLLPGVLPRWGFFGGMVLLGWSYFVIHGVLLLLAGTPYILTTVTSSGSSQGNFYGVPAAQSSVGMPIDPSWMWTYLAPALLFTINLFLVLRVRSLATVPK